MARSTHGSEVGTSEMRDGNGRPRRNRNKRRHKNSGSDTKDATVNARFNNPRTVLLQLIKSSTSLAKYMALQINLQIIITDTPGLSSRPKRLQSKAKARASLVARMRMNLAGPIMEAKKNSFLR